MNLRRAMAVAAATGVLAPAVFLSAPAAFADESPGTDHSSPALSETDEPAGQHSSSGATIPSASATTESAASPTPSASTSSSPSAGPSATPTQTGTTPSGSPTPTGSTNTPGTPPPTDEPKSCLESQGAFPNYARYLHTSLSGVPDKIVAGSGFHAFKLNVTNEGESALKRVELVVAAAQEDPSVNWGPDTSHLTLQYKDPASGKWKGVALDGDKAGAGYLGYTDVRAKESFSVDVRLNVDKSAPAYNAHAETYAGYADDEGICRLTGDASYYGITIVTAGKDPGKIEDAKPQGGKKPLPVRPAVENEIQPEGSLAETGSSSATPVIGIVGGIAILAGAGVVFAMKRRKNGASV